MRSMALALLILLPARAAHAEITEAKVTGGVVSGVAENGISVFKGIPFAAPPVGDRRWQAPAPVTPWSGVKKADAFANACMQPPNSQGNTAPVSEDCLYLNVWTPAKSANAKVPVIVWVHGGGFTGGSTSISMYNGAGFAKKGVVLVSVSYRVGLFGFHEDQGAFLGQITGDPDGGFNEFNMPSTIEWSVAAYGDATFKVNDNLRLLAGLRGSSATPDELVGVRVVDRVVSGALGGRQSPMSRAPGSRWRWAAVTAVALLIVSIGTWQRIVLRQPTVQVNAAPPRSGGHYVIVVPASEVAP